MFITTAHPWEVSYGALTKRVYYPEEIRLKRKVFYIYIRNRILF